MTEVPVVLFAYARPAVLARTLESIRRNGVETIIAYADGARSLSDAPAVAETRALLKAITWARVVLTERAINLGLGKNVMAGVSEVAATHEAFIVWEDDLVAAPGTYRWLCEALGHYQDDPRVMSVTGWTGPAVRPVGQGDRPYFDGRAECWLWGAYARSWAGMAERSSQEKLARVRQQGMAPDSYGADLVRQARDEQRRNLWASRWLYHHLEQGGLCLRPPWNLVEHLGVDAGASNFVASDYTAGGIGGDGEAIAREWPEAVEHPDCRRLWKAASPTAWGLFLLRVRHRLFGRKAQA